MRFLLFIIISFCWLNSASQCETAPSEYVLEQGEDYLETEVSTFSLIECLLFNSAEYSKDEFEEGIAYSIIWIGGTPSYKVEVNTDIAEFLKEEPQLLYPYILSLALAQKNFEGALQIELESEAIAYLYQHFKAKSGYAKSKSLEKMNKKYQKGKLITYLESLRNQE